MAGSDKYEKAVGRARGQEVTTTVGGDIEIQDGASFGSMEITPDEAGHLIKAEKWEMAPKVGALEPNKHYKLFVEGNGPDQEIKDKQTGVMKLVPTWIVSSLDGIFRVRLLGSYDLNQKMVDAVGSVAIIFRHPDRRLANGNMFTEYDIAVQPRKDGKRREWTRHSRALAEIHAIDVPALPAAGETAAPQGGSVIEAAARAAATNHTA